MAEDSDSPVITMERHLDKKGLRNQQALLMVIAALMLVTGGFATHHFGLGSFYTMTALGGGVCFVIFTLAYGAIVTSKLKNTHYVIFDNRIEYRKGAQVLQVIPLSELTEISEERTQWQKSAGLTSVVLNVRPGSYLTEEEGIAYFVLADVAIDAEPSERVYEALMDYREKADPKRKRPNT